MSAPALVLASKSRARREVLGNAGVTFTWCDADVDEQEIKATALGDGTSPWDLALILAEAKAKAACSKQLNGKLFIGCDQVLALGAALFDKPKTMADAGAHLRAFSGRTHQLISAVCLVDDGETIWSHVATADMHVRSLSEDFIQNYLEDQGEKIMSSVGAYFLEGAGAQLFSKIDGDYFTVLGLPLLPLLEELRKRGILPA